MQTHTFSKTVDGCGEFKNFGKHYLLRMTQHTTIPCCPACPYEEVRSYGAYDLPYPLYGEWRYWNQGSDGPKDLLPELPAKEGK